MYCMLDEWIEFKKLKVGNELDKRYVQHSPWTLGRKISGNISISLFLSHYLRFSFCLLYHPISLSVRGKKKDLITDADAFTFGNVLVLTKMCQE